MNPACRLIYTRIFKSSLAITGLLISSCITEELPATYEIGSVRDNMKKNYILIELIKILLCIKPIKAYAILKKMDDVSKDSRTLRRCIM